MHWRGKSSLRESDVLELKRDKEVEKERNSKKERVRKRVDGF